MQNFKNQPNKFFPPACNFTIASLALVYFFALTTTAGLALTKIQEAYEFYKQKKFSDAVSAFDLHLQAHPSDTNAIYVARKHRFSNLRWHTNRFAEWNDLLFC